MNLKFGLLVLGIICFHSTSFAQPPVDSVKNVIRQFFTGMRQADTTLIRHSLSPTVIFQTVETNSKGISVVKNESVQEFLQVIAGLSQGAANEEIEFLAVHVDGSLASAWTPYQFYYQGKFSHCGVNSFQLVRIEGSWQIQYIIDTRHKADCQPKGGQ